MPSHRCRWMGSCEARMAGVFGYVERRVRSICSGEHLEGRNILSSFRHPRVHGVSAYRLSGCTFFQKKVPKKLVRNRKTPEKSPFAAAACKLGPISRIMCRSALRQVHAYAPARGGFFSKFSRFARQGMHGDGCIEGVRRTR